MEIRFKRDTELRKLYLTKESFCHPAKMDAQLLLWLVERYSKPGDIILDVMLGSGTTLLACTLGRHVVGIELESKFVRMSLANWERIKTIPQLGHSMGKCLVFWGDARDFSIARLHPYRCLWQAHPSLDVAGVKALRRKFGLPLQKMPTMGQMLADMVATSPPYAEGKAFHDLSFMRKQAADQPERIKQGQIKGHCRSPEAEGAYLDRCAEGQFESKDNIGILRYGDMADAVVTSPAYGDSIARDHSKDAKFKGDRAHHGGTLNIVKGYQGSDGNIGQLPYGDSPIDAVFTSPPYMQAQTGGGIAQEGYVNKRGIYQEYQKDKIGGQNKDPVGKRTYMPENAGCNPDNIQFLKYGSLSSGDKIETYLQAMYQVYGQCFLALKPGGVMVLVTKNFIRDKQIVRLDLDTIKLAEAVGFKFLERHYRRLPAQSFWRNNYRKKYPDVDVSSLDFEDVLVFRKEAK